MEDLPIKLGSHIKVTLKAKPEFRILNTSLELQTGYALSESNCLCTIAISVLTTSISGNISNCRLLWIFYDNSGEQICTYTHGSTITLLKVGLVFRAANIIIPVTDIFKQFRQKLLGKSGKLAAQISITNLNPISIPKNPGEEAGTHLFWNATYTLYRNMPFNAPISMPKNHVDLFNQLKNNPPVIGDYFSLYMDHGSMIPQTARFFFIFWENDLSGKANIRTNYTFKSQGYDSHQVRRLNRTENMGITSSSLIRNDYHSLYLGCDTDGKLNYYDTEGVGLTEDSEFNYMLGFIFNDESNVDFVNLNNYSFHIRSVLDNLQVKTPKLVPARHTATRSNYGDMDSIPEPPPQDATSYLVFIKFEFQFLSADFKIDVPIRLAKRNNNEFTVKNRTSCGKTDWERYAPAGFRQSNYKLYTAGWIFGNEAGANGYYALFALKDMVNTNYGDPKQYFEFGNLQGAVPVSLYSYGALYGYHLETNSQKYDYIALPLG